MILPTLNRCYVGNCLEIMRAWPEGFIHSVITSPPYWGLRSYKVQPTIWGGDPACQHEWTEESIECEAGKANWTQAASGYSLRTGILQTRFRGDCWAAGHGTSITDVVHVGTCQKCGAWRGCLGNEPTPAMYVEHMVQIFREVRRLLRDDGTLWLNIGDSFAASGKGGNPGPSKQKTNRGTASRTAGAVRSGSVSMSQSSSIEWTEATWNPLAGCTKVSPGCKNCYAMTMAHRLAAMAERDRRLGKDPGKKAAYIGTTNTAGGWTGKINLIPDALDEPIRRKKPTTYFVNSMSDLFHKNVPFDFVDRVFAVMALCPQHTFQILTKRPKRMGEYIRAGRPVCLHELPPGIYARMAGSPHPLPNVWLGCSPCDQRTADEYHEHMTHVRAAVRWYSVEPLLGRIDRLPLDGISWVVCGGEFGSGARPCNLDWIRSIRDQCKAASVACFIKQIGAVPVSRCSNCGRSVGRVGGGWVDACGPGHAQLIAESMRDRKGGDMLEWPADLWVREMPVIRDSRFSTGPEAGNVVYLAGQGGATNAVPDPEHVGNLVGDCPHV